MDIRTLIVDDQRDIRDLIRLLIERANQDLRVVGEAESGADALRRLDEDDPVVIVLDQMMPNMNGLETAALIRERRPSQIIILCSAVLTDEIEARAEALGVRHRLPKEAVGRLPELIRQAAAGSL